MRLKSFEAKDMMTAMRQVKETLGDDAIIVSTREEASGWVRITAAVEKMPEQENAAAKAPSSKSKKPEAKRPAAEKPARETETVEDVLAETLLKHKIPAALGEKIISQAFLDTSNDPAQALALGLAEVFSFDRKASGKNLPLMLVGPPGAGKTLMAAKLAARAVMNGKKPAVITTDIARAGGIEQLGAFLDILELPLLQAENARQLSQKLGAMKSTAGVIIDTGGLNPFDPQELKTLAQLIAVTEMDTALVLPAGTDAEESAEMAMTFEILGVKKIIPTRLDFARRLGGILNAADKAGLSFGIASHTPQVAQGILDLTPDILARYLLPKSAPKSPQKGVK
jgi:flagellar biosynthesis protein FlhF